VPVTVLTHADPTMTEGVALVASVSRLTRSRPEHANAGSR